MPTGKINLEKMDPSAAKNDQIEVESANKRTQEKMQLKMKVIFELLFVESQSFDSKKAFSEIVDYINQYDRIIYSTISDIVYQLLEEEKLDEKHNRRGTLLSNLDSLMRFCDEIPQEPKKENEDLQKKVDDISKAIWKIWDHTNLAIRQYESLKQTDDEFKKRFNEELRETKENLAKELNAQLLSIIGIFTALAFILFGGISSFQSVFEGIRNEHILKLLILGCGWGLGMLNVIFVFLFCVGKMTKLPFKSTLNPKATFWQKYPVVCWTNFLTGSILVFLLWLHYCINRNGFGFLDEIINLSPRWVSAIGSIVIMLLFIIAFKALANETKAKDGYEDE